MNWVVESTRLFFVVVFFQTLFARLFIFYTETKTLIVFSRGEHACIVAITIHVNKIAPEKVPDPTRLTV